jgi:hypothetical protein
MKSLNSLCCILLLSALPVSAQKRVLSGPADTIRINFSVGKSSDNTFTKSKSAEISALFPDNDTVKKSWLINSFAEFGLISDSTRWSLGMVGEIHKNTLVAKEQNVFQYGLSMGRIFSKRDKVTGASVYEVPLSLSLKYSIDHVKKSETFQAGIGLQVNLFQGCSFLKTQTQFPRLGTFPGKIIEFSHNHNLGMTYLGAKENVLLGQFDFEFNAFLLPYLSDKWIHRKDLFKAQFTFNGRTPLLGSTDLELNSLITFQAGINYAFDAKNSIELAYSRTRGADPLNGLSNQEFEMLSAKIKISFK